MIKPTKKKDIKQSWHLIDAKGQVLGRLACKITPLLIGKRKPYFVKNLDCGDHVIIINAKDILVTGKKETEKFYYSYSGYPSGLSKISFNQLKEKFPERIIINAVSKMLPQNKLRSLWLKKLHVFGGSEYPYGDKLKEGKEMNEGKTEEKRKGKNGSKKN